MTTIRRKRLMYVLLLLLGVGMSVFFATRAMQDDLMFFYSPTEIATGDTPDGAKIRIGGLVLPGSFNRVENSLTANFVLTDTQTQVPVSFTGILPDLFREGQGIVAHGRMNKTSGVFMAEEVLAKHDENYMSPEVVEALKAAGHDPTTGNPEEYGRDIKDKPSPASATE